MISIYTAFLAGIEVTKSLTLSHQPLTFLFLQTRLRDPLKHFKDAMLKVLFDLLCELPEKEQLVLTLLVSKLVSLQILH